MSDDQDILDYYATRKADARVADRYGPLDAENRFTRTRRMAALIRLLEVHGQFPLWDKHVLDVGCGSGATLRGLVDLGADPARCVGLDINQERLERARYLNPGIEFVTGGAEQVAFEPERFDIVTQFIAFSSMQSPDMRTAAASEILRVLRPGGFIVWYDFRVRHPQNPHVVALRSGDIRSLFPRCSIDVHSVTLAPPIVRRLASVSEIACLLLEKLPPLRTHYLAGVRKPGAGQSGGSLRWK